MAARTEPFFRDFWPDFMLLNYTPTCITDEGGAVCHTQ